MPTAVDCFLEAMLAIRQIFEKLDPKEHSRAADAISECVRGQYIRTPEEIKLAENDYLLAFCERARRKLGINEYEFARRQAARNKKQLPPKRWRGAGGVDADNLYRHIREQRARQQHDKEQFVHIQRVARKRVIYEQPNEGQGILKAFRRAGDLGDL
jgi:hypothetical protein